MLVHSVYFWLKSDISEADRARFRQGLEALASIETVQALYVGQPIPSTRPVVDSSYSFGLTVIFQDKAGLDVYGPSDTHQAFLKEFGGFWDRILIYDTQ